jgi:tetratricopeptide (TPR) repeat protein
LRLGPTLFLTILCLAAPARADFQAAESDSGRLRLEIKDPASADSLRLQHAPPRRLPGNPPTRLPEVQNRSIPLARQLLSIQRIMQRDAETAVERLEALYLEYPRSHQLRLQLGRGCRLTGRLERSEELLRGLLDEYPASGGYRGELIRTLFKAGKDDDADRLLAEITNRSPASAGAFEEAANLLMSVSRMRRVEAVYREGLRILPVEDQRGRLRLVRRLFELFSLESAPERILLLLAQVRPDFADPNLRERLMGYGERFLAESEGPELLIPLADSLAAAPDGPAVAGILREIYLAVGDHARFADQVLLKPVPVQLRATWFHDEGMRCLDDRRGDPTVRRAAAARLFAAGLEKIRVKHPQHSRLRLQLARLRLEADAEARLRGELPGVEENAALRKLLLAVREENPGSEWSTYALIEELRFLRERLRAGDEAEALLRAWFLEPGRARGLEVEAALELELGESLMAAGRFEEAREHYGSIQSAGRSGGAVGWAAFRLAQLLVLDGDKMAAQDSLAAIAEAGPGGALANDALDLALLLAESATWPASVQAFLDGSFTLEYTGDREGAAARLLTFAMEFPDDLASPALLYRAGQLYRLALRGKLALEAWLLLADHHPDSFRAPQALEQAARLALRIGDADQARLLLERILLEHPDFPLRPGLRDLQERLEEEV